MPSFASASNLLATAKSISQQVASNLGKNDSGNAPVMFALGSFKFSINTTTFQEMTREKSWTFAEQAIFGAANRLQATGLERHTISLPCIHYPEFRSVGVRPIQQIEGMGDSQKPFMLIDSNGEVRGYWVIEGITEVRNFFDPAVSGQWRKIEFTLRLKFYGDSL